MKQSALFFDIDGTILSEITKKIPDSALAAMSKAKENGHRMYINTGRTYCNIPAELRRFDFDGYLCGCGSYLVCRDEVVLESHIGIKRGQDIIDKMYECRLDGILEGTQDAYFPAGISRFEKLESSRRYFKLKGLGMEKYIQNGGLTYDKLFVYADGLSDKETFFEFVSEDMEVIARGDNAYEIAQKEYSKATACEFIRRKLNLTLEEIYVFGDSGNDLPMFEYAVHTVAMGEHAEILEPYTEFVTKKVEEDGIAYAMEHYGLI